MEDKQVMKTQVSWSLKTRLNVWWVYTMSYAFSFFIFSSPLVTLPFWMKTVVSVIAILTAPFMTILPTEWSIRLKATKLARQNGASYDGNKDRSKLGIAKNGEMVLFTSTGVMKYVGHAERYVKGQIQRINPNEEALSLHKRTQQQLEWIGSFMREYQKIRWTLPFVHISLMWFVMTVFHPEWIDGYHTVVTTTLSLVLLLNLIDVLFHYSVGKGQSVHHLTHQSYPDTYYTIYNDKQFEMNDRYLKQQDMNGIVKAIMLDGSLLIQVERDHQFIEYALLQRK